MIRLLISLVFKLLANAVGLLVANWVLDDMTLGAAGFFVAVLIFTVVEVVVEPMLRQAAVRNVQALSGSVALITTFVGLLLTDLITDGPDGLDISGVETWLAATVIVWLAALLAGILLPLVMFKKTLERHREKS